MFLFRTFGLNLSLRLRVGKSSNVSKRGWSLSEKGGYSVGGGYLFQILSFIHSFVMLVCLLGAENS